MKQQLRLFTFVLMCLAGIGMSLAETVTYTFTSKAWAAGKGNWTSGKDGNQLSSDRGVQVTAGTTGANATSPSSFTGVSSIVVTYSTNATSGAGTIKVQVGSGTEQSFSVTKPSSGGTDDKTTTFTFSPVETGYVKLTVDCTGNSIYIKSVAITYEGSTTQTATAEISSTSISVGGTATITTTPANLDVTYSTSSASVATVAAGVVTGVAAGAATITATWAQQTVGGITYASGSETFAVTVSEPQQYTLYSGELVKGDYIIYYNGMAMNTTVSGNRLQYEEVTPADDVITTSDNSIIWHIAPSGSYWTIYNAAEDKYAASNGTNNQAQMLAVGTDGTDDKALWTVSVSTVSGISTYEFENKNNAANSKNANLRNNGTYGFACYGTGTGGALSLYKASIISDVSNPSLTASATFFPKTTETATFAVNIAPVTAGSTVAYTTDGTTPSATNGTKITASTTINISATTTVKAIAYAGTVTSDVVTQTYTLGQTVNSIAAFKALASGTEARLYLSAENNARVIHYNGNKEAFIRDNTGAICIYLDASIFNPTPAHNQHVAGWIIAKYQPFNGLPEMVATDNTNTDYLAFAEPVTEEATAPHEIGTEEFGEEYYADWIKINDLRVTNDGTNINAADDDITLKVYNKFSLTTSDYYQAPYNNALVDLTGIVIPYNSTMEIAPLLYDDYRPVIYVVDETKEFTSPSADMANATVRLKRSLSNTFWNTFAAPFDITDITGTIREYDKLDSDGTTMLFKDAETIQAGKPYLIMPENNITNPVYYDVTLTATTPQTVTDNGYSFVATYGPATLATDKTDRFLKTDGYLYYPASAAQATMKGMRAYFNVPASADAKVNISGNISDMIADIDLPILLHTGKVYSITGQLVGVGTDGLPRGIYIVNGKKVLIK